jgi:hypothetical protein
MNAAGRPALALLAGKIPDFSGLPSLQRLWLERNGFQGPFPDGWNANTAFPKLTSLTISGEPKLTGQQQGRAFLASGALYVVPCN